MTVAKPLIDLLSPRPRGFCNAKRPKQVTVSACIELFDKEDPQEVEYLGCFQQIQGDEKAYNLPRPSVEVTIKSSKWKFTPWF